MMSAPASAMRRGVGDAEHVRSGQQVEFAGGGDHLHLEPVAHAGLLEVLPEDAVDQTDRREVLHAGEAGSRSSLRKTLGR